MKKLLLLVFVLMMVSTSFGSMFPIFNRDRGYWIQYQNYGKPIVVDTLTSFGFTKSTPEKEYFLFRLKGVSGDISFDSSQIITNEQIFNKEQINVLTNNNICDILGYTEGYGIPLDNLVILGTGVVDIYKEFPSAGPMYLVKIGEFTVVPEPSTIILFSIGIGIISWKKRNKYQKILSKYPLV